MTDSPRPLRVASHDTVLHVAGNGQTTTVFDVRAVAVRLERDPRKAARDAIRMLDFLVHVITKDGLTTSGSDVGRLREALAVGERFLNGCNSAWAAGEPSHRVQTMLDLADEFRAALDALATPPTPGGKG